MANLDLNDPVTLGLRASARQLAGVAVFSGIVNLLTLSGSIYMLQVYDRVIPSRNVATLLGLSLIVVLAYLLQGYFDALRTRMLSRIGSLFDVGLQEPIHVALATANLGNGEFGRTKKRLVHAASDRPFCRGSKL